MNCFKKWEFKLNNSKIQLANRTLWYDGTTEIEPDKIPNLILSGVPISKIASSYINSDVTRFNQLEEIQLETAKTENRPFDLSWQIPKEYLEMDIVTKIKSLVDSYPDVYKSRASLELNEISRRNLEDLFRTIFYIVDTFKQNDCMWGVGRGSSCASLILFLIGLHKVDPIKFGIDASEFFHD